MDDTNINYEELLFQLMHEMRQINHIIKSSSEIVSKSVAGNNIDKENLEYHSNQIFEHSYLVSLWLDIIDFEIDPDFFSSQRLESSSLYGKFKKSSIGFKRIGKSKNVSIDMTGDFNNLLDCYPVIDILPYIILDNAVKYSPSYGAISIDFDKRDKFVNINVSSMGPVVENDELEMIFSNGYRAKSAIASGIQGGGRGLAIAKHICDIHDAEIKIVTGDNLVTYEDIQYSSFDVHILFPI